MKRPPIPRALLPHRAELHDEAAMDAWQHPETTALHVLEHIRIDADLLRRADEKDTEHSARWLLFYDCRNSLPREVHFAPGQVIRWNSLRLTVKQVTPVWADQTLHHYEVELEGG